MADTESGTVVPDGIQSHWMVRNLEKFGDVSSATKPIPKETRKL
jgi:hypothetical protein